MTEGSPESLVCPVCGQHWPPDYWQCRDDGANLVHQESEPEAPGIPDAAVAEARPREPTPSVWRLSVQGRGTLDVPDGQTIVLGRSADLASSLLFGSFDTISRFHCAVTAHADRLEVCDVDSTNGTFVNNERLEPKAVHDVRPDDFLRLASNVNISILLTADGSVRQQPAKEGSP